MHNHPRSVRRSLLSFYESIPVTSLLTIALLVIGLGYLGCSNPPADNATTSAPAASPANVTLPVNVTQKTKNPLPDLATAANLGKPLYQANCALCHGDAGASDGPASSSYNPKPADLTKGEVTTEPDGKLFLALKHGKGKMPGMKRLTDEQIWQVVAYVRTLAKQ